MDSPFSITTSVRVTVGGRTLDVQESDAAPPGAVLVRDAQDFVRFLRGAVAPAAAPAPAPAALPEADYTLLPRDDGKMNPIWAKCGLTREAMAHAVWTKRRRLTPVQWEVAQAYLGINMSPMRHNEIEAATGRTNSASIFRDAVRLAGLIPKSHGTTR